MWQLWYLKFFDRKVLTLDKVSKVDNLISQTILRNFEQDKIFSEF